MVETTPAPVPSAAADEKKSLVVKNAVGEYIRAKELKVSSDLYDEDALNGILKKLLDAAMERCKANGRKTVMKQDL
jgi:histone H3/H4